MATKYKTAEEIPSKVLSDRLKYLSNKITDGNNNLERDFYMSIPAQIDHDADLVLMYSARRLMELEKELEWFKIVYGNNEELPMTKEGLEEINKPESKQSIIDRLTIEANNGIKSDVSAIEAVKFRMEQYGLNQSELAKIIGLGVSQMSEFLSGKRKLPKKSIVKCIAIGVSYKALLSDV